MTISIHRVAQLTLVLFLALVGVASFAPADSYAAALEPTLVDQQQAQPDAPSIPGSLSSAALYRSPYPGVDSWTIIDSPSVAGLVSDNFNACTIDETLWTLSDPPGAATFEADGQHLVISVPEGVNYDFVGSANNAARATQTITQDEDFQVVAKFDSITTLPTPQGIYRLQGVLVGGQSDPTAPPTKAQLLRFEFYTTRNASNVLETHAFAAVVGPDNDFFIALDDIIPVADGDDIYLRVTRETVLAPGGLNTQRWVMEYSKTGDDWTEVGPASGIPDEDFILRHISQNVGVYAGNATVDLPGTEPAHTANIDFFLAQEDPITTDPDDDTLGYDVMTDTVGDGSVAVTPTDPGPYMCGEDVTLTATPDSGWSFANWSGDVTGTANPTTVPFDMGLSATANFSQGPQNELAVTVVGDGVVTSDPAGIDCGTTCTASFAEGANVELTAVPAEGSVFSGWTGAVTSTDATITVSMDAARSVTATFSVPGEGNTLTVQTFPADGSGGTVTSVPAGIDCGSDCSETYTADADVALTAVPSPGYEFVGWSGGASGEASAVNVVMDANKTVIATFVEREYSIAVTPNGGGSVAMDPPQTTYAYGDTVVLTASPIDDFTSWGGDVTSTENPLTIVIGTDTAEDNTAIAITANFGGIGADTTIYLPLISGISR